MKGFYPEIGLIILFKKKIYKYYYVLMKKVMLFDSQIQFSLIQKNFHRFK